MKKNNFILSSIMFLFLMNFTLNAQQSQNELLQNFTSDNLNVFKVDANNFIKQKRKWPVSVKREGDNINKLIVNRAGVVEEIFEPDLAPYPAYFKNLKYRIVFANDHFYYISWANRKATIKYVLTTKEKIAKDYKSHLNDVQSSIDNTLAAQSGSREELAVKKAELAEAERKANSLEGKDVKSISVKWIGETLDIGHYSKIGYGIEATLSDGRVFKTSNLGGKTAWEDFKISVIGAVVAEEILEIDGDARKIPGDVLSVTVSSKYQPSIKDRKELKIQYNSSVYINHSGSAYVTTMNYSYGSAGKNGKNLKVLVTPSRSKTGDPINKVEIRDAQSGLVLHRLKLGLGANFNINVNGQNGTGNSKNAYGGKGGNGGNVTIIKAPKTLGFSCNIKNYGGKGGKNRDNSFRNGSDGSDGIVNERISTVQMNW